MRGLIWQKATNLPHVVLSPVRKGGDSPAEHINEGQDMTDTTPRRTHWVQLATLVLRSLDRLLPQPAQVGLRPAGITAGGTARDRQFNDLFGGKRGVYQE